MRIQRPNAFHVNLSAVNLWRTKPFWPIVRGDASVHYHGSLIMLIHAFMPWFAIINRAVQ